MASLHSNVDSVTSSLQQSNHNNKHPKITHHNSSLALLPWTSQIEHRIYYSNLLHALRRNNPLAASDVRATADRVLAATARARTRWSRAILANPFRRWKHMHHKKKVKISAAATLKKRTPEIPRRLPALRRKARVLGRLIPGCRKMSFPKLLEEAGDYISALEMQVRTMTALADILAGGATPPPSLPLS